MLQIGGGYDTACAYLAATVSILADKVGPVPVPVILGGVGVGLVIALRRKKTAGLPSTATNAQPGYGSVGMPNNAPIVTSPTPTISTNNEWFNAASSGLFKTHDPTFVTNALGKYLRGDALTPTDKSIVDEALRLIGPAPQPPHPVTLLPETTVPAPPTAPPQPQPNSNPFYIPPGTMLGVDAEFNRQNKYGPEYGNRGTYTVGQPAAETLPGLDVWQSISKRVYGSPVYWGAISRANPGVIGAPGVGGKQPAPGTVLWLPADPTKV